MRSMKTWKTSHGVIIHQLGLGRSGVFLVTQENVTLMVDSSIPQDGYKLASMLMELGYGDHRFIDYLILTHSHFDHAGNAAMIKGEFRATVVVHRLENEFLQKGFSPVPHGTNWFLDKLITTFGRLAGGMAEYPFLAGDILVDDSFDLANSGLSIQLVHTPGHTPGSMSVIVDGEIALTGDAMFGITPDRTFPPFGNDSQQIIKSWKVLLDTGCSTFIPSHGQERSRAVLQHNYDRMSEPGK
jgi:hydroxyacylglutathione hydrolase